MKKNKQIKRKRASHTDKQGLYRGQRKGVGAAGTPPPKEYQWKPGQSGNPAGRPKKMDSLMPYVRYYQKQKKLY